jgi:hypothetical protein
VATAARVTGVMGRVGIIVRVIMTLIWKMGPERTEKMGVERTQGAIVEVVC